jgi:hypothetical protein
MPPEDDNKDDKPKGDDFAVKFKTEGEFLSAVDKKLKSRVKEAVDTATSTLLARLGVESPDDIEGIAEKLKAGGAKDTEVEALKKLNGKLTKENEAGKATIAAHVAKIQGVARRDALMPFAGQVRDVEALSLFVSPHLEVSEDGVVTGKDGKTVEQLVADTLKTKDYLRNPDFKPGTGSKPTGSKIPLPFKQNGEQPLPLGQKLLNDYAANHGGVVPGAPVSNGGGP